MRDPLPAAVLRCGLLALAVTTTGVAFAAEPVGLAVQVAQAAGQCAEVRQVELETREPITAAGYGEARDRAVRQALVLAVGVAGGAGGPVAAGAALDYRSARTRIVGHEVLSERVERQGGRDSIVVAVRAGVCVPAAAAPPAARLREVIAVGDFLDNSGRPLPGARQQLIDFFRTLGRSDRFDFIEAHPASTPADIVIAGRVTGGGVTSSGEQLEVRIVIEARDLRTGQVITSSDVGEKGIKRGADVLQFLPEAIRRAIERAGPRVYVGIEAIPPPQVAARPPIAPPPIPGLGPVPRLGPGSVVLYVPRCMDSFRHGALAAAGTVDEALLEHVVASTVRCTQDAWSRTATRRDDWVSRDHRRDRRYKEMCERLERELERMYSRNLEGSPQDRLRDRILGLCRDELPQRMAVAER